MFNDDIKISVIISNNDLSSPLSRTLDSLKEQSFESMEIICVVDNEDVAIIDLLEKYRKDMQITLISHDENISNRNKAINLAKGDYIQLMNYGDYLSKDTLKFAYEQINKDNSDVIIYNLQKKYDENRICLEEDVHLTEYANEVVKAENLDFVTLTCISENINSRLYKATFLNKNNICFSEEYPYDDNIFNYKVMCTSKMSFMDKSYYMEEDTGFNEVNLSIIDVCEYLFSYSIKKNHYILSKKYTFNHIMDLLREKYYSINKKDQEKYYNLLKDLFDKIDKKYQLHDILHRYLTSRNKTFYNHIIHSKNYYQYNENTYQKKNMKKDYKISLIIPVYNSQKKEIETFFNNIKLQSINFKYLELLFIDNNSQDYDGMAFLKELYDTYSNVNVIYLTKQNSISYQKNIGIKNSKGKYILFTALNTNFNKYQLEELYKIMIKEHCEILFANTNNLDNIDDVNIQYLEDLNYLENLPDLNCTLYERELIKKYKIQFEEESDYMDIFNKKAASYGNKIMLLSVEV